MIVPASAMSEPSSKKASAVPPHERDIAQEDFETRKADLLAGNTFAGRAADEAAAGELED